MPWPCLSALTNRVLICGRGWPDSRARFNAGKVEVRQSPCNLLAVEFSSKQSSFLIEVYRILMLLVAVTACSFRTVCLIFVTDNLGVGSGPAASGSDAPQKETILNHSHASGMPLTCASQSSWVMGGCSLGWPAADGICGQPSLLIGEA